MNNLLELKDIHSSFFIGKKEIKAVDGVSFELFKNETLAIVGESGSGKSVTVLSIMGLLDANGKVIEGEIQFKEKDLLKFNNKQMNMIRGNKISMIYQDPLTTLNPSMPVGEQIKEILTIHHVLPNKGSKERAIELMELVNIPEARNRYHDLPKKFSGGMRQRIVIAMAIACNPEILIADEPTTALDVTIQSEIMELLLLMKNKIGMSMILITHDLGIVAENADRVIVMYCGKIMEEASVEELFLNPLHPYTLGLMECIPRIDLKQEKLYSIPGYVPHPSDFPTGCRFSNRCENVMDMCKNKMPELIEVGNHHKVRCWLRK